jgi:hypothetical protein
MDTFKTRLEFHMARAGLNPTSLSRKAGLNTTGVRDILKHKGAADPRMSTFIKLCVALEVAPHVLSPELLNLYPPGQRRLLAEAGNQDEKDHQVQDE